MDRNANELNLTSSTRLADNIIMQTTGNPSHHSEEAAIASAPQLPLCFSAPVVLVASKTAVAMHCRVCLRKPGNQQQPIPKKNRQHQRIWEMECGHCGRVTEVKWQYHLQLGVLYEDRIYAILAFDKQVEDLLGLSAKEFYDLQTDIWRHLKIDLFPDMLALVTSLLVGRTFHVTLDGGGRQKDPLVKQIRPADPGWVSLKDYVASIRTKRNAGEAVEMSQI